MGRTVERRQELEQAELGGVARIKGVLIQAIGEPTYDAAHLPFYGTRVKREAEAAHVAAGEAVRHAVSCGCILSFVKAHLDHGEFGPWLKEYFPADESTAQRWMRLAQLPDAILRLPHFGAGRGYALLALPDKELAELEQRIEEDPDFADRFDAMSAAELREWCRKRDGYDETWRKRHDEAVAKGQEQIERLEDELDRVRRGQFFPAEYERIDVEMKQIEGAIVLALVRINKVPDIVPGLCRDRVMDCVQRCRELVDEAAAQADDRLRPAEIARRKPD